MPILDNPKHESFAQALAQGLTVDEAYQRAGYSPNRGNASRLNANESVMKRVEEIRLRASAGLEITMQWLLEKAEEARQGAMQAGQHAAAVSAIKELGILSGHRIEKREQTTRNICDLSDDELARIAFGGGEGAVAAPSGSKKPH